jgi:hypothetical protein
MAKNVFKEVEKGVYELDSEAFRAMKKISSEVLQKKKK